MKILHIPYCFYPDAVGGTEIYVESLCHELIGIGTEVVIAAPGRINEQYKHDSLAVQRFAVSQEISVDALYGNGDSIAAANFSQVLDNQNPDVVHLHSFTSAASIQLVRAARNRGIPVIFTYHTPTVTCARGTLLKWGNELCDGYMDNHVCAQCNLNHLGMSKFTSKVIGSIPPTLSNSLGRKVGSGGMWTAIRMSELITTRHHAVRSLFREVQQIVVMAGWTKVLLLRNDVPESKISHIRHGISEWDGTETVDHLSCNDDVIRLAYLGRIHPVKGIHLVLEALKAAPSLRITLDIYGVLQSGNDKYMQTIQELVKNDTRVCIKAPIPYKEIIPLLRSYHALVVPSQWLETGPLVVLEAFAAGTPVIGSDLGGISEWVKSEVNGLLVTPPDSVNEWQHVLERIGHETELCEKLQSGVAPPPTMKNVAQSMSALYTAVLQSDIS